MESCPEQLNDSPKQSDSTKSVQKRQKSNRVSLRCLTIQNFRSFEGKHTFEFDLTGLYLLRGTNLDTRGESASGKSSLLLAIAYALDFAPYAATDLRSWHNDDPFFVELELMCQQGVVTIHRGDKLWLKISPPSGKDIKVTSAKAVAEKLDEICGMNKTLRSAITYRKQRTFGLFLGKRDSEKKSFLVELLKLHWLEEAIEKSVTSVSEQKKVVDVAFAREGMEKALTDQAVIRIPTLTLIDLEPHQAKLDETQVCIARAKADWEKEKRDLERLRIEEYKLIKPFMWDTSEEVRLTKLLADCQTRIRAVGDPDAITQRAHREINRLQNEMAQLFDEKCPRCDRTWDAAQAELENNRLAIEAQEKLIVTAADASLKLARLQLAAGDVAKLLVQEKERERNASRVHAAETHRAISDPDRPVALALTVTERCQKVMDELLSQYNRQATALSSLKYKNETAQQLFDAALAAESSARKNLRAARMKLVEATLAYNAERDLLDMLRGFLGQIFGEILREISDETNRVLSNLPNASGVSIRFDTDRETLDGKTKSEITPVVTFGGKEWPLESGASGGMFTSIELAVDLAVAHVIARRTGVDLGWLILDESFANGSDKITKEGCLEILKQYSKDKLIIVVEHASEFKELFSRVIEVQKQHDRSKIL